MKKRAADIIMETLVENGITDAFCVVGGGSMFLDNAAAINPDINVIFNHHEQACAMACDGYARIKNKMALCLVTSGPGGTNTLTGVMGAYQDSIPMIVISGQVRYNTTVAESGLNLRRRGEQEFDIVNSVKNMTKYAKMIIDPLSIKQEVQKAIDIAMSSRRGPVWLDIPLDVQSAIVEEDDLLPVLPKPEMIKCSANDFEELKTLIKNAKAPVFLLGSAVRSASLTKKLYKVMDIWKIPSVSACIVSDVLPDENELYFGTSGNVGTRCGNLILDNCDLLVVLGCSLGFKQTSFSQDTFAKNAKIVMIDVNEDESKKSGLYIHKFIHSDQEDLFDKIVEEKSYIEAPVNWVNYCNKIKKKFDKFENAVGSDSERVNAYNFWKKYQILEPENNITVLGNSSSMSGRIQNGNLHYGQRTLTNMNCGSMGYDIPAAIGACAAANKEVFLVTGDGSFMMNLQELQTIKHNNLPIKIVIFSNDGYCGIVQTCKNYFNGKNFGCTYDTGISFPSFEMIAKTFDFKYNVCETNGQLDAKLNWLFTQKERALLEIKQQYDNPASPCVKSRLTKDGKSQKVHLSDMYPFMDRVELEKLKYNRG